MNYLQELQMNLNNKHNSLFTEYIEGIKELVKHNGGFVDLIDYNANEKEDGEGTRYSNNAIRLTMAPITYDENAYMFAHIFYLDETGVKFIVEYFEAGGLEDDKEFIYYYTEFNIYELKALFNTLYDKINELH